MSERSGLPHKELVIATAHDLLMTPLAGEPAALEAPRDEHMLDETRIVRARERRVPRHMVTVELDQGDYRQLPMFEISYTGLDHEHDMRRLVAGALGSVVVASRIGGRYLHRTGMDVQDSFGHPARIIRDPQTGALLSAQQIGVPQPTAYQGAIDLRPLNENRPMDRVMRLVNYLPEDMFLLAPGDDEPIQVSNCGNTADVDYRYEPLAQTEGGIVIARSTPEDVVGIPARPGRDEMWLVHTEVLFEGLRLGIVSPEEASHMVVACGIRRMPSGQQGNMFTGLAYYSIETLEEMFQQIKL